MSGEKSEGGERSARVTNIGVLVDDAESPLATIHAAPWVAALRVAMLRDSLDGLQAIDAARYAVYGSGDLVALGRHVPLPWLIVRGGATLAFEELSTGAGVVAVGDAPSFPTDALADALASDAPRFALGRSQAGLYAFGWTGAAAEHARRATFDAEGIVAVAAAAGIAVVDLPEWYVVRQPDDVTTLLDEMRRHPERAPRTAHFVVTQG